MTEYNFAIKLHNSKDYVRQFAAWFATQYPDKVCHVEDMQSEPDSYHKGDIRFFRPQDAQFIEVKVEESYTSSKTPNLAIERYSDLERRKDGGPWQTTAQWYVHLYMDGLAVMMNRLLLVLWLDKAQNIRPFQVTSRDGNRTWITKGYLVNRAIAKAQLKNGYKEMWWTIETAKKPEAA